MDDEEFISTFKILEDKKIIVNIKPNDNYGSYRISELSANESLKDQEIKVKHQTNEINEKQQTNENKFIEVLKDTIEFLKVEIEQKNGIIITLLDTFKSTRESGNTTIKEKAAGNKKVKENEETDITTSTVIEKQQQQKQQEMEQNMEEINAKIDQNYQKDILNKQLTEIRKKMHQTFLKQRYNKSQQQNECDIQAQQYEQQRQQNSKNKEQIKEKAESNANQVHRWQPGTTLIAGDSIVSGLIEKKMGKNVKIRSFPGACMRDMYYYLEPLLMKCPTNVILHACTNDAIDKEPHELTDELLQLKQHVENTLPGCTVIISYPTIRTDKRQAKGTLINLRKTLDLLQINSITNENITEEHLGKGGLHLNAKGSGRLAMNYISFIRHL